MRTAIRIGLLALAARAIVAQSQPSAPEIVQDVIDAYRQLSSFSLTMTITTRVAGDIRGPVLQFKLAAESPDKVRTETDAVTTAALEFGVRTDMITVANGTSSFIYLPRLNQYLGNRETGDFAGARDDFLPPHGISLLVEKAVLLREKPLPTNSGSALCYVIEIPEQEELACISHKLYSASARNVRQRCAIGDLASAPGMTA